MSSKIGLAILRTIDYQFPTDSELVNMNVASLILALRSLSEGVAEREIQKKQYAEISGKWLYRLGVLYSDSTT